MKKKTLFEREEIYRWFPVDSLFMLKHWFVHFQTFLGFLILVPRACVPLDQRSGNAKRLLGYLASFIATLNENQPYYLGEFLPTLPSVW